MPNKMWGRHQEPLGRRILSTDSAEPWRELLVKALKITTVNVILVMNMFEHARHACTRG